MGIGSELFKYSITFFTIIIGFIFLKMTNWWKSLFKKNKVEKVEIPVKEVTLEDLEEELEEEWELEFEEDLDFEEDQTQMTVYNTGCQIKESELRIRFESETGKYAVWRGKITNNYTKYKENYLKRTGKELLNDITESL